MRTTPSLLDALPPDRVHLPAQHAPAATPPRTPCARCGSRRELLDGHALVKLEVLGDPRSLFPNVRETIKAAEALVADGFEVMVYTSDDPIVARELEAIGCVAIMPLASLIGSGMGILNPWNLRLILDAGARCRCWSTRAWAPRRTRRSPWSSAAPAC